MPDILRHFAPLVVSSFKIARPIGPCYSSQPVVLATDGDVSMKFKFALTLLIGIAPALTAENASGTGIILEVTKTESLQTGFWNNESTDESFQGPQPAATLPIIFQAGKREPVDRRSQKYLDENQGFDDTLEKKFSVPLATAICSRRACRPEKVRSLESSCMVSQAENQVTSDNGSRFYRPPGTGVLSGPVSFTLPVLPN